MTNTDNAEFSGFRTFSIPKKYSKMRGDLENLFHDLTELERLIYCAYLIMSYGNIANMLNLPKSNIVYIHKRACEKVKKSKQKEGV